MDSDLELALQLQREFDREIGSLQLIPTTDLALKEPDENDEPIISPELEDLDPTPDLHELFMKFDKRFFWRKLRACEVRWSPRMTLCAGICSYRKREGYCSIRLSLPLLKLRPRKDMVETLLHEMIHAYLFVTDNNDNHDGHGPQFHKHMHRINKETGTKISVYHNFHDEVNSYKQHWWKCDGPCVKRRPFYGLVKRSMNRAPGPNDTWHAEHKRTCGGTFIKIKEPEGYGKKKKKKTQTTKSTVVSSQKDIRSMFSPPTKGLNPFSGKNIVGFGGTSYGSSSATSVSMPSKAISTLNSSKALPISKLSNITSQPSSSTSQFAAKSLNDSADLQRKTVREAWLKRFCPDPKEVIVLDDSLDTSDLKLFPCPVCGEGFLEKAINAHLDVCLSSPPQKQQKITFIDEDETN